MGLSKENQFADAMSLEQSAKMYDWNVFRPSFLCAPFKFVLQLVLVGCCGSFLFGFNVSVLNTSIDTIASEFQFCGKLAPFAEFLYETVRTQNLLAGRDLCTAYPTMCIGANCVAITNETNLVALKCAGGYTDRSCDQSRWYEAFLKSAVMISGTFGALAAGLMVSNGRRNLLMVTSSVFFVGIVCSVFANSFAALLWARLIVGLGVGMVSVASPTYISEMTPRLHRGKYGTLHQLSITVGILIGILLGLALPDITKQPLTWIPTWGVKFWWRFMLGLGMVPTILSLYLLSMVYTFETPIYYIEQDRQKDAHMVYEKIMDRDDVYNELNSAIMNVQQGKEAKAKGQGFMAAFSNSETRYVILVGLALSIFQQLGGINVFVTSSSNLFKLAGLSQSMQVGMSFIMGLVNVLMTFVTILIIDRFGRRTALLVGSIGQSVCVLPAVISYWSEADSAKPSSATVALAVFAVLGFVVFFAIAFGPVVWVYLFEIFPMEIKDSATSICTAANWLATVIIVFIGNAIRRNEISFTIFFVMQLLATVFVYICIKETKGLPLGTSPFISSNAPKYSSTAISA